MTLPYLRSTAEPLGVVHTAHVTPTAIHVVDIERQKVIACATAASISLSFVFDREEHNTLHIQTPAPPPPTPLPQLPDWDDNDITLLLNHISMAQ
jgi:hypothetical protein